MLAMNSLQEAAPNTDLAWLLFVVLGFFLLMVVIGWLVSRRNGEQVEHGQIDRNEGDQGQERHGAGSRRLTGQLADADGAGQLLG